MDQFGRKRYQKKRKDIGYEIWQEVIQKYFVVHELWVDQYVFFLLGLNQICYDTWIITRTVTSFGNY